MNNKKSYDDCCILFRSDIDSQEEYNIAETIFHDQLVRYRTSVRPNSLVVGRYSVLPWYFELETELKLHGSRLINTHTEHSWIADVTAWAGDADHYKEGDLQAFTPKTWTTWSRLPDNMAFIAKGRTNSRKWKWNTHMFAKDKTDLLAVTGRLLDDNFISEQGLVIREHVPLRTFDHGFNGLPITNEWRCFFLGNELVSRGFYWANMPEIFDQAEWTAEAERFMYQVAEHAAKCACFFVLDIAQREDGSWVLIEVNDGQMSGLSTIDPIQFYTKLNNTLMNLNNINIVTNGN